MFPLFITRCLHDRHDVRDPSGGSGDCGRECCRVILPKWRLPRHLRNVYMPQIYDMGPTALLPLRRTVHLFFYFVVWPTNAQLIYKLSLSIFFNTKIWFLGLFYIWFLLFWFFCFSVISIDFDAEVFWRHLLGIKYFVKPNGCILFQ